MSNSESDKKIQQALTTIIQEVGEDTEREGLIQTPRRFAKAIRFLTSGYQLDAKSVAQDALFDVECEEMVIVKDIEFYSLCEHHLLPITGKVHVGYLPNGKVIGLSKIARVVDVFARRLQVQERMTYQIAAGLLEVLDATGIGVIVEALHYCMIMRGVQKQNSKTVTSSMLGSFREDSRTRDEFITLTVGRHSG